MTHMYTHISFQWLDFCMVLIELIRLIFVVSTTGVHPRRTTLVWLWNCPSLMLQTGMCLGWSSAAARPTGSRSTESDVRNQFTTEDRQQRARSETHTGTDTQTDTHTDIHVLDWAVDPTDFSTFDMISYGWQSNPGLTRAATDVTPCFDDVSAFCLAGFKHSVCVQTQSRTD